MIRPVTIITQFIQEMSAAVDHDHAFSIQQVQDRIELGSLIPWLRMELHGANGIDLSMFGEKEMAWLHEQYQAMLNAYAGDERRKWGIVNNGLCLLISWGTDIIRLLPEFDRGR